MITLKVEVMGDRTRLTRSLYGFRSKGEISTMNNKMKSFSNITLKHFLLSRWRVRKARLPQKQHISNHEKPIKNLIKTKHLELHNNRL